MEIPDATHALYTCSLKLLLRKGDSYLFLRDAEGFIDLPGGRIDNNEHKTPISEILQRESREELGDNLVYQLDQPAFQFRRNFDAENEHVFVTVYTATHISGEILLSNEHGIATWITRGEVVFQESDFRLQEEYLAFQNYFLGANK